MLSRILHKWKTMNHVPFWTLVMPMCAISMGGMYDDVELVVYQTVFVFGLIYGVIFGLIMNKLHKNL